jgi:hypothetical protein
MGLIVTTGRVLVKSSQRITMNMLSNGAVLARMMVNFTTSEVLRPTPRVMCIRRMLGVIYKNSTVMGITLRAGGQADRLIAY